MQELPPPQYYLLCNGQEVSRTEYAELFAIIGTTWGAGNGSTTFNVPNLAGRTTISAGTSPETSETKYTFGRYGGSKDAVVVTHTHNIQVYKSGEVGYIPANAWPASVTVRTDVRGIENTGGTWTDRPSGVYSASRTMSDTGSSGTDKNMMPYAVVNKIIRAK